MSIVPRKVLSSGNRILAQIFDTLEFGCWSRGIFNYQIDKVHMGIGDNLMNVAVRIRVKYSTPTEFLLGDNPGGCSEQAQYQYAHINFAMHSGSPNQFRNLH